jgi:hypothetical protein
MVFAVRPSPLGAVIVRRPSAGAATPGVAVVPADSVAEALLATLRRREPRCDSASAPATLLKLVRHLRRSVARSAVYSRTDVYCCVCRDAWLFED